ncbi:14118_t:CDS:2 [Cetraspora pellucida]|uniref:14118_t:CDS:1 n=1 Tax=Cetraspora pellucida TaxID=1433469 RepID=A0A9N8W725_9GLOM|nr:14118_t:CDS:2 [Cetraspora pellucida]
MKFNNCLESRSAAAGTWRTRVKDDDDNNSLGSSIYSQPSVLGDGSSNLRRQNTTDSRRHEPLYEHEEDEEYKDYYEPIEYPPSPHAGSVTTRGSTAALTSGNTQPPLYDQHEKNNNYQQYYRDFNQGPPEQFDVYNDFNNNLNSYNYNEETASNPSNGALAGSNAYSKNNLSGKGYDLPSEEKGVRHSTTGEHLVVQQKRRGRCCCCCSKKLCVIITFIILVILGVGVFFVWPRLPSFAFSGDKTFPSPDTTPIFRMDSSPIVSMDFIVTAMVDNRDNWLPFYFKSINVQYFDPTNSRAIGSGVIKNYQISSRSLSSVDIPISVLYQPTQLDLILNNYITACTIPTNNTRGQQTLLGARFELQMFIFGLDWIYKPSTSITISDLKCPYEVPLSTSTS